MPVIETKGAMSSQGFGEFAKKADSALYVENVFGTNLYSASNLNTSPSVPALANPVLSPASVDPDWQYVKRYLPLIDSNSYDVVTNTQLGGNLDGGIGYGNPYGGNSVTSYSVNDTTDYSSYYSPISGANYNGPWCIEAWVYVERVSLGLAKVYIHDEGSQQNSIILSATGTTGGTSGQLQAFVRRNDVNVMAQYITIPGAQWVFVSLSYDGSTLKVHVNDQLRYSIAFTGWTTQPNNNIRMGCQTTLTDDTVLAMFCQYRATFGSARTSTRGVIPSRPFPITGQVANCTNALLWFKRRGLNGNHFLQTVDQGYVLASDSTATYPGGPQFTPIYGSWYTIGVGVTNTGAKIFSSGYVNDQSGTPYVMWAFTAAPKFFDIVEYTGTGTARTVNHNLGATPGMIIVKNRTLGVAWAVYHTGMGATKYLALNTKDLPTTSSTYWNNTAPTATDFTVGTADQVNRSGNKYIAYVFANNAGGFGLSGTDSVISCGSFVGSAAVNLGWEPQWVLVKNISSATFDQWSIVDNMRGAPTPSPSSLPLSNVLNANSSTAEDTSGTNSVSIIFGPTGFKANSAVVDVGATYIYVAIRRGPMKKPTDATKVFYPVSVSSTMLNATYQTGFPVDMAISGQKNSNNASDNWTFADRLSGMTATTSTDVNSVRRLLSTSTSAESSPTYPTFYNLYTTSATQGYGLAGASVTYQFFRRAPSFFDTVCYTGTGSARTVNHNLGVVPELMVVKCRSATGGWTVYSATVGPTKYMYLNSTAAAAVFATTWNNTAPTSSVFTVGSDSEVNSPTRTYVAYLFATCPGVSKVGSYTGTGTTQQINCGFAAGARFVLIKRTDSTGGWYVWDSARGIVAGNDPYILLNDISAEVTTTDYVDTYAAGFEISSTAPAGVNASGGTYIYLAIA